MKSDLITICYDNIETVTAGGVGISRRRFGDFTDTGKSPAYWVKSPYSIAGWDLTKEVSMAKNLNS
jgi:hypothetical protein